APRTVRPRRSQSAILIFWGIARADSVPPGLHQAGGAGAARAVPAPAVSAYAAVAVTAAASATGRDPREFPCISVLRCVGTSSRSLCADSGKKNRRILK